MTEYQLYIIELTKLKPWNCVSHGEGGGNGLWWVQSYKF